MSNELTYKKASLSEACWIWMCSPVHREWPIHYMQRALIPAFHYGQYLVFYENDQPIGYVSWAFFNEEVEVQYIAKPHSLKTEDWKCGDRLWFPDFIALTPNARRMVSILRTKIFPDHVARSLRVKPDSDKGRVITYHGINKIGQAQEGIPPINFDLSPYLSKQGESSGADQSNNKEA